MTRIAVVGLGLALAGIAGAQSFQYFPAGDHQLLIIADRKLFELTRGDGAWSAVGNAEQGFDAWRRKHYEEHTTDTFAQGVLAGKFSQGKLRPARLKVRVQPGADETMLWTWDGGPAAGVTFRAESQDSVPRWAAAQESEAALRTLARAANATDVKNLLESAGSPKFKSMLAETSRGKRYAIALGSDLSITEFAPARAANAAPVKPAKKSEQGGAGRSEVPAGWLAGAVVCGLLIGGFASYAGRLTYNAFARKFQREQKETYARVSDRDQQVLAFLREHGGYELLVGKARPHEAIHETLSRLIQESDSGKPRRGSSTSSSPSPIDSGSNGQAGVIATPTGTGTDSNAAARISELEKRVEELARARDSERRDNDRLREDLRAEEGRINAMALQRSQLEPQLEALAQRLESLNRSFVANTDFGDLDSGGRLEH